MSLIAKFSTAIIVAALAGVPPANAGVSEGFVKTFPALAKILGAVEKSDTGYKILHDEPLTVPSNFLKELDEHLGRVERHKWSRHEPELNVSLDDALSMSKSTQVEVRQRYQDHIGDTSTELDAMRNKSAQLQGQRDDWAEYMNVVQAYETGFQGACEHTSNLAICSAWYDIHERVRPTVNKILDAYDTDIKDYERKLKSRAKELEQRKGELNTLEILHGVRKLTSHTGGSKLEMPKQSVKQRLEVASEGTINSIMSGAQQEMASIKRTVAQGNVTANRLRQIGEQNTRESLNSAGHSTGRWGGDDGYGDLGSSSPSSSDNTGSDVKIEIRPKQAKPSVIGPAMQLN